MKKLKYLLFLFFFVSFIHVDAAQKSIENYSYGVDGRVSVKSISVKMNEKDDKESLILSSTTGIYITKDNSYVHIDTISKPVGVVVINDINNDDTKDIVYAINNAGDFYNLVAVSGKDGEIIWSSRVSKSTYDYTAGFKEVNKTIYKIESIETGIAVIHDYTVEVFDFKTGNSKFYYEDKDNIWDVEQISDINSDSKKDFVISNQLGEVKAFDGTNGKLLWKSKLIKDFVVKKDGNRIGEVTRNVWQVVFSNDNLYAVGEDGTLYNINYKNGKTIKTLSIFEFDTDALNKLYGGTAYGMSNILPIGKNSPYFRDFEMFLISGNKAIITAFVNKGQNTYYYYEKAVDGGVGIGGGSGELYGGSPFMVIVDLNKLESVSTITLNEMKLSNVSPVESVSEKIIAIPTHVSEGKLVVSKYNIETFEKLENYEFYIGASFSSETISSMYTSLVGNNVLVEANDGFSMLLDSKVSSIVKNNDNYANPNIIFNDKDELAVTYTLNQKIERIVKYSSISNKQIAWEYVVTNEFPNDGLFSISITHDFNGDGVKDLTALVNKKDKNNNVVASYMLILDMKTGGTISFKSIYLSSYYENKVKIDVYLKGSNLYAINDITGDKKPDLVLDNSIINPIKNKVIGVVNESLSTSSVARMIKVGDINGDGFSDIVTIEEKEAYLHLSKKSSTNISYTKTNTKYTYAKELLNYDQAVSIPDIDNDGISDIVFNAKNGSGKQYYKIISGKNLSLISNINEDGISANYNTYAFLNTDIDGDGYDDLYEIQNWGNSYNLISGKTGKTIIVIAINPYGDNGYDKMIPEELKDIIPFTSSNMDYSITLGSDINKDGHNELLFLKESYYPKQETILQAYDVFNKNSKPIKEIQINSGTNTNNSGGGIRTYDVSVMPAGDVTKLLQKVNNTENLYVIKPSNGNTLVYDLDKQETVSGFTKSVVSVSKLNDNVLFAISSSNGPININYSNTFEVKEIKNKKSPLKLEWTYEDYGGMNVVNIYDNGSYIKTSYGSDAELLLRKGKHVITFESVDKWGKILSGSVTVDIAKSNVSTFIYSVISFMLILFICLISFGPKIRRNMMIRRLSNE